VKSRSHLPRIFAHAALPICITVNALTPRAAADALEHGFVEPCTLANVQEPELDCEVCAASAGVAACEVRMKPRGFAKKCRTRGTHAGWDEIWCVRSGGANATASARPASGTTGLAIGLVVTLAAMVLMMRVISGRPAKG